ncbi:NAD(P)H-hydrate dehydratase [Candidatus Omnitrophota bacterium]
MPTRLLQRNAKSHKGHFGHLFAIAGSARFSGAAALCAEAGLRCGAGLVTLGIPKSLNSSLIKIKPLEVMTLPLQETPDKSLSLSALKRIKGFVKKGLILVIGPGLGRNGSTQQLVRRMISEIRSPMVIDADGLNALVGHLELLRNNETTKKRETVLTPHPGEMSRLTGASTKAVAKNRRKAAKKLARDYRVTVVLKGHNTVVADCRGNLYVNKTGNPGMAKGGSGDVLAGMIGAFLGQGLKAFAAAKYAVYLHGLAGDLAAKKKTQVGMIATDIIKEIPAAIRKCS